MNRKTLITLFVLGEIVFILAVGAFVYFYVFRHENNEDNHASPVVTSVWATKLDPTDMEYNVWVHFFSDYSCSAIICRREEGSPIASHTDGFPKMSFRLSKDGDDLMTMKLGQDVLGGHVYFIVPPEILRKVSFEELGIKPIPVPTRQVDIDDWAKACELEITRSLKEYLAEYAGEIFGETEPQS